MRRGPQRLVHDPHCETIKNRNMSTQAKIKCNCGARARIGKSYASGDAGDWDRFTESHEEIGGGNYRAFTPLCD